VLWFGKCCAVLAAAIVEALVAAAKYFVVQLADKLKKLMAGLKWAAIEEASIF